MTLENNTWYSVWQVLKKVKATKPSKGYSKMITRLQAVVRSKLYEDWWWMYSVWCSWAPYLIRWKWGAFRQQFTTGSQPGCFNGPFRRFPQSLSYSGSIGRTACCLRLTAVLPSIPPRGNTRPWHVDEVWSPRSEMNWGHRALERPKVFKVTISALLRVKNQHLPSTWNIFFCSFRAPELLSPTTSRCLKKVGERKWMKVRKKKKYQSKS